MENTSVHDTPLPTGDGISSETNIAPSAEEEEPSRIVALSIQGNPDNSDLVVLTAMPAEIVTHVLNQMQPIERTVAAICLGLTCKKLHGICQPYWFDSTKSAYDQPTLLYSSCVCTPNSVSAKCSHDPKPLSSLLKGWMGSNYRFIRCAYMPLGGCFLNIEIYGKRELAQAYNTKALIKRWATYNTIRQIYPPDECPSPYGQGDEWCQVLLKKRRKGRQA